MKKRTIVIAPTERVAREVVRHYMQSYLAGDFIICSAAHARRVLEGRRDVRIVIVDYINWTSTRPGAIADLWQQIWVMRDFGGSEVVWWR